MNELSTGTPNEEKEVKFSASLSMAKKLKIYTVITALIVTAAIAFSVYTVVTAKKSASISEAEWAKKNAAELESAQKLVNEANAQYESAEAENAALLEKLGVTQSELDKTLADLRSITPPELDIAAIKEKYETVGELVTINYTYEYTSKATDNGKALSIFGSGDLIFWDTKEFLYKIPGVMKLGVDLPSVKDGLKIDAAGKTITLTIPAAYVIANDPDENNVERYDLQKGWLNSNPVNDKDLLAAFAALETELKQKVQKNGILKYAQELAGYQIKEMLQPIASISGYAISLRFIT